MESIKSVDKYGNIHYKSEWGDLHREDGPAIESINGYKGWWLNGVVHREDGPAIEYPNGDGFYYLNGRDYTKEDWEREVLKLKLCRIKDL